MTNLERADPEIAKVLRDEEARQETHLELIASENFVSRAVMEAMGSVLTNKYAEGYPGKRYYGGCQVVDVAEDLARERAKKLFGCDHVNVQPHSGSQANMGVYFSVMEPGDTYMALNLAHGGHLTMGSPVNFSGKIYKPVHFGVRADTGRIDYDEVEKLAIETKPKLIVIGASAYSRKIDYERFRAIADKVGAKLMADIAHIAGLVVAKLHPDPVPHCDFVTTTTHKTLRGPRGGMIMCKAEFAKDVDSKIFPGMQGGPLMHVIAAKAVAFKEALEPAFKAYQRQIVANAAAMAEELMRRGWKIVSGGTDNHLMMMNFSGTEMTGKKAEAVLDLAGVTANKNMVPFDERTPFVTSGIRLGTPAVTTRGMKEAEMRKIAEFIDRVLRAPDDEGTVKAVREEVRQLCASHPLYRER